MTREEARAALLQGAESTNCQYLTVVREHLLIALGDESKVTNDVPRHKAKAVDNPA